VARQKQRLQVGHEPEWRPRASDSHFTLARESDLMFDVVQRMARRDATTIVVSKNGGRWRPGARCDS
jgi:hypothetical protein